MRIIRRIALVTCLVVGSLTAGVSAANARPPQDDYCVHPYTGQTFGEGQITLIDGYYYQCTDGVWRAL